MRKTLIVILALSASAASDPVRALEASDTMASWSRASGEEKSALVFGLLKEDGRNGGITTVMKCLDAAAGIAGHADLPIGELVKVCEKESGQPV